MMIRDFYFITCSVYFKTEVTFIRVTLHLYLFTYLPTCLFYLLYLCVFRYLSIHDYFCYLSHHLISHSPGTPRIKLILPVFLKRLLHCKHDSTPTILTRTGVFLEPLLLRSVSLLVYVLRFTCGYTVFVPLSLLTPLRPSPV